MAQQAQAHGHSVTGMPNKKLMMWAFLASDCMFFGSLLSTYLLYRGRAIVGPYPLDVFDAEITTVSTFVLLMSSFLMVLALHAAQERKIKPFRLFTGLTAAFGLVFLSFQVYEFNHFINEGLKLGTSVFGSSFYVLTGTHGVHVAIGVLWLLSLLAWSYGKSPEFPEGGRIPDPLDVEVAGLYWHFVDVVWIILFTVVYLAEYVF